MTVDQSLKYSVHIDQITAKAKRRTGLLFRCFITSINIIYLDISNNSDVHDPRPQRVVGYCTHSIDSLRYQFTSFVRYNPGYQSADRIDGNAV